MEALTIENRHYMYVHTVQVACKTCPSVCVRISKWLVGKGKTTPASAIGVGGGSMASHVCTVVKCASWYKKQEHHQRKLQMTLTASASDVFVLIDGKKNTNQCKLQMVKTILGTSRSWLQQPIAGSTREFIDQELSSLNSTDTDWSASDATPNEFDLRS